MATPGTKRIFGVPIRRLKAWAAGALLLLVVGFFLFGEDGIWRTMVRKRGVERLESRVDSLATLNKRMRTRMVALKEGDKQALEEEARARGMVKPGEKVYLLKEKEEKGR